MSRRGLPVLGLVLALPIAGAGAQPLFGVPFHDVAPRLENGRIVAAAAATPGSSRRMDTGRLSARRLAESRARAQLHRYLDDALAAAQASPPRATEAHAALDAAARVAGTRWLVEGGVVVVVACPREALRSFALRFPGE